MTASYFDQFTIVSIIPGITNSSLMLILSGMFIIGFFNVNKLIPGR